MSPAATADRVARVVALPPAEPRVVWTLIYVAFLSYIFAVTTYRLPIATAAMIAALIGLVLQREGWRLPPFLVLLVLFLGWCVVSSMTTAFPAPVQENVVLLAKLCVIVLVATNAVRSPAQVRFYMIFFLACYALFPIRGTILNYVVWHETLFGRAIWNYIYDNPNDLAAMTLLALSIAAALLAMERTGWIRWCAIAGLAVLPMVILMTQSRGGFVALCVFAALAMVGRGRARRMRTALIIATLAVALVPVAPSGVWTRVKGLAHVTGNLDEVDPEGSAKDRFEIWQVATAIVADHPWTGIGWGAYPQAHANYSALTDLDPDARGQRDTHSTYLNVLAETGFPGLLLFLAVVGVVVRAADRARRRCLRTQPRLALQLKYLELGLVAFLVAGVFGSFAKLSFLYLHLVLLWAAAHNATAAARLGSRA